MDAAYLLMDDTFYFTTRGLIAINSDYTGQRWLVMQAISIVLCVTFLQRRSFPVLQTAF